MLPFYLYPREALLKMSSLNLKIGAASDSGTVMLPVHLLWFFNFVIKSSTTHPVDLPIQWSSGRWGQYSMLAHPWLAPTRHSEVIAEL